MSSRYQGERIGREATAAVLRLVGQGIGQIADLVFGLGSLDIEATPEQTRRLSRYLREQNYLTGSARTGYALTEQGMKRLVTLELKTIESPPIWDGKWRIMIFDIPEEKRILRNQVRRLIKQLNCLQLQQSVWVHPFPCFQQFRQICQAYGPEPHIILLETIAIEGAPTLRKSFQKIYPDTVFDTSN